VSGTPLGNNPPAAVTLIRPTRSEMRPPGLVRPRK
jgi:hypothetical protein